MRDSAFQPCDWKARFHSAFRGLGLTHLGVATGGQPRDCNTRHDESQASMKITEYRISVSERRAGDESLPCADLLRD